MVNQEHTLPCGEKYFIHPHHRTERATQDKCVWIISPQEELDCFNQSYTSIWYIENLAWGNMHNGKDNLFQLGINWRDDSLRLAKFIKNGNQWHGYPIDINNRPKDRPLPSILDKWLNNNIISKPLRSRIQGGRL